MSSRATHQQHLHITDACWLQPVCCQQADDVTLSKPLTCILMTHSHTTAVCVWVLMTSQVIATMLKDNTHPSHSLLTLLPSDQRYRSITRHQSIFIQSGCETAELVLHTPPWIVYLWLDLLFISLLVFFSFVFSIGELQLKFRYIFLCCVMAVKWILNLNWNITSMSMSLDKDHILPSQSSSNVVLQFPCCKS